MGFYDKCEGNTPFQAGFVKAFIINMRQLSSYKLGFVIAFVIKVKVIFS